MSGVAAGFVLSRTMVFWPHLPFKGIIDSISQSESLFHICLMDQAT